MARSLLLLSGGGARGALQVAPIEHVCETTDVAAVCGSSIGAINGLAVASLKPEILRPIWRGIEGKESFMRPNVDFWNGIYQMKPLVRLIEDADVLNPKIRFHVGHFDLASLRHRLVRVDELLTRADRLQAVLASSSIPGIHQRIKFNGRWVGDGGIANVIPIPENWWANYDEIHAVFCQLYERPPEVSQDDVESMIDQLLRTLDSLLHFIVRRNFDRLMEMKKQHPEKRIFIYSPEDWSVVGPTFDADPTTILRRLDHGREMVRTRREL